MDITFGGGYAVSETEKKTIAAIDHSREKLLAFARRTAACGEPGFLSLKQPPQ